MRRCSRGRIMVLGDESSIDVFTVQVCFHAKSSQLCPRSFFITTVIVAKVIHTIHMLMIPLRTIGAGPASVAAARSRISKNGGYLSK